MHQVRQDEHATTALYRMQIRLDFVAVSHTRSAVTGKPSCGLHNL